MADGRRDRPGQLTIGGAQLLLVIGAVALWGAARLAGGVGRARPAQLTIGVAQLLLVIAAVALWAASRLPWVVVRSFDGLGPRKEVTLSAAAWSTALLPLALLMLATAVAALAVRGWALRVL